MDQNSCVLWGHSAHSLFKSLPRSSVARMMVPLAQKTLSVMIMRVSPDPGYLGNAATSHPSLALWSTPLS